jgi:hypothetical protein
MWEKQTMEEQEERKTYGHLAKFRYRCLYLEDVLPIHVRGKVVLTAAITATLTNCFYLYRALC